MAAGLFGHVIFIKVSSRNPVFSQKKVNFAFTQNFNFSSIEEYRDCRSIKGRFQQYFVHGDSLDCASWEHDFEDCLRYTEKDDIKAGARVIEHETERRKERLKNHYSNNVWKKRDAPPEDWAKPLPEHLNKQYENSFLDLKSKELKGSKTFLSPFVVSSIILFLIKVFPSHLKLLQIHRCNQHLFVRLCNFPN